MRHYYLSIILFLISEYNRDIITCIRQKMNSSNSHPDRQILTQIERCLLSTRGSYNTHESVQTSLTHLYKIHDGGKEFIKSVFYNNSFKHIKELIERYEQETGKSIESLIARTYSKNAFVFHSIVMYLKSPSQYFSFLLHKSMEGGGTDSILLSTVILMRCEIDMEFIKKVFKFEYEDTLRKWIRDDTCGHYKCALYKLIGEEPNQKLN